MKQARLLVLIGSQTWMRVKPPHSCSMLLLPVPLYEISFSELTILCCWLASGKSRNKSNISHTAKFNKCSPEWPGFDPGNLIRNLPTVVSSAEGIRWFRFQFPNFGELKLNYLRENSSGWNHWWSGTRIPQFWNHLKNHNIWIWKW